MNRPIAYCDLECYRNYFLCKFLFEGDGTFLEYPMFPGAALNRIGVMSVLARHTIVTFNGNNYDMPVLALALTGVDNQALKDASDRIIKTNLKPWEFRDLYNVEMPNYTDHIDIMEILPGVRISLKTYGGIAHCKTIQDLPIDPDASINMIQRVQLSTYCSNDLTTLQTLYKIAIQKEWVQIREHITAEIGIDVRSKSDAQIAEAIARSKLGFKPKPPNIVDGWQFTYKVPAFIKFNTSDLNEVLRIVSTSPFTVVKKDVDSDETDPITGKKKKTGIRMHPDVAKLRVKIGNTTYKFGAGGLHSQESSVWYETDATHEVCDDDVGSFYPRIRINQELYPEQCTYQGLVIYKNTYYERMADKKAGRKKSANTKKIVLNGEFGKHGSKYSMFYAPALLMQITITGQLMLLMLISALENAGVSVVSANTDGIVTYCHRSLAPKRDAIMREWEKQCDMELERTRYKGIYLRDVNNYFAITLDGEIKRKGIFTPPEVGSGPSGSKAPNREICSDAVIAYVKDGTPISHTIYRCKDIRKFVTVRAVTGGCYRKLEDEPGINRADTTEPVGKVVRWVYRRDYKGALYTNMRDSQVADSLGAWPVMTLPDEFPSWIDYEYYIGHANEMLKSIGKL